MNTIDEDWLAEALHDLGSAIEVPSNGPQEVLAARGALTGQKVTRRHPATSRPSRRRQLVAVGVALASVGVLAVGLVLTKSSTASDHRAATGAFTQAPEAVATGGPSGPAIAFPIGPSAATSADAAAPRGASTPGTVPAVSTKVVKTGTIDLQVGPGKLSPAVAQLTSLAGGLGGYVANATTTEVGAAPGAEMTLRVPVDQFETLLTRTQQLGKPTSVSTSGQDVTASFVDLNARIQALQDTRTQYLQILAKATTIGDILSVEQQLSDLQTQLEQLQGQQTVLADQTSFGTLTVHISVPGSSSGVASPPHGLSKAWDHARSSFAHGVEAVIAALGGVLVFLVCAGLVLLAARLSWPLIRRRLV